MVSLQCTLSKSLQVVGVHRGQDLDTSTTKLENYLKMWSNSLFIRGLLSYSVCKHCSGEKLHWLPHATNDKISHKAWGCSANHKGEACFTELCHYWGGKACGTPSASALTLSYHSAELCWPPIFFLSDLHRNFLMTKSNVQQGKHSDSMILSTVWADEKLYEVRELKTTEIFHGRG